MVSGVNLIWLPPVPSTRPLQSSWLAQVALTGMIRLTSSEPFSTWRTPT